MGGYIVSGSEADCKSAVFGLGWFNSIPAHQIRGNSSTGRATFISEFCKILISNSLLQFQCRMLKVRILSFPATNQLIIVFDVSSFLGYIQACLFLEVNKQNKHLFSLWRDGRAWLIALVLKTSGANNLRGFKSLSLLHMGQQLKRSERWTENPKDGGSIPLCLTKKSSLIFLKKYYII